MVFLIGMTINRPWRLDGWLPVFAAMPDRCSPSSAVTRTRGCSATGLLIGGRGPTVVQYWSGVEAL